MKSAFWKDESFWFAVGSAVAAVLSSAGLVDVGAQAKAVIDAGAALVVSAYVHRSASSPKAGALTAPPSTSAAPAVSAAQVVAQSLEAAAATIRQGA
ncbi:MAG TPA: hypothetical protein VFN61_04505 [Acidimicrobiales bacterium]|nr:hypothetical protein [Acidimicrobiales bacterium]